VGAIQIFVQSLAGRTLTLDVRPHDLISDVKSMIQAKDGTPVNAQRLLFGGKQLEDERTIADYHVQRQHTLMLVGSIRGSGRHRTPTPEPTQAQPVVDPPGVPADPNHGDCPPPHFGLGTICGALQTTYSLTHLTTDSNRQQGGTSVRHGAGLECLSDHGYEAAFSHLVNHSGCLPDEPRIVPELAHHPQIAAILRALDVALRAMQ